MRIRYNARRIFVLIYINFLTGGKKDMKNKAKLIVTLSALITLAVIAGTFAYWNQTSTIENPFNTGRYGSTVIENFRPEDGADWQPGAEINKDVLVENTGDQDMIVRVKLDEKWTRKGEENPYKSVVAEPDGNVYQVLQEKEEDGLTDLDKSVVHKNFNSLSENWIDGGDGWYYYKLNLKGGELTDRWLDSVTLDADTDMGKMETRHYVTASNDIESAVWVEYTASAGLPGYIDDTGNAVYAENEDTRPVLHNKVETTYALDGEDKPILGYSDSDFILSITVQTVQATAEALEEVFGSSAKPAGCVWILADE